MAKVISLRQGAELDVGCLLIVEVKQELQNSESSEEEEAQGSGGVPVVLVPRVNTPPQEEEPETREPSPQPKKKAIVKRMPKKRDLEGGGFGVCGGRGQRCPPSQGRHG